MFQTKKIVFSIVCILAVVMKRMMGEKGEALMHQVMGKRFSGCDTSIAFPVQDVGFVPMMSMMGAWSSYGVNQWGNSMMNFGFSPFGWFMIVWWCLVVIGFVAVLRWVVSKFSGKK